VFLLGMVLFFQETLRAWAAGSALLTYVLFTLTGVNFLVELGLNLVLSPAVSTLIRAIRKTHN
jgi:membrane protein implicated in regulation of membrane protease activity